jgi:hypothetical protein
VVPTTFDPEIWQIAVPPRPSSASIARDILDVVFLDMLGQLDPKAVQSACIRVFQQRAEHAWPPAIDIPPAWRVELASLAAEQALPFATGDEVVAAFMNIYRGIVEA